jgi:hypothetical protein
MIGDSDIGQICGRQIPVSASLVTPSALPTISSQARWRELYSRPPQEHFRCFGKGEGLLRIHLLGTTMHDGDYITMVVISKKETRGMDPCIQANYL